MIKSVTKIIKFETAHQLSDSYAKECQKIHGHSYTCEVTIEGSLDPKGMIVDFKKIKESLQKVEDKYDHNFFTEDNFGSNPTAENMALDIFNMVRQDFVGVKKVRLWETATCFVEVGY